MDFIQACGTAISIAKESGGVTRVYPCVPVEETDFLLHRERFLTRKDKDRPDRSGWLFMSYPGGRKVLSLNGVKACRRLGIDIPG